MLVLKQGFSNIFMFIPCSLIAIIIVLYLQGYKTTVMKVTIGQTLEQAS